MPRQRKPITRVHHLGSVHFKNRDSIIQQISYIDILAVFAESNSFGKPSDFDFIDFVDRCSSDRQNCYAAGLLEKPFPLKQRRATLQ